MDRRLREQRLEVSPLRLDGIRARVTKQVASPPRREGSTVKSRLIVAMVALGLMAGGTGGVLAATSAPKTNGAASSQYKPGVGPCKTGGVNPSGTHTGAPGNGNSCDTKPGNGK